MNRAQQIAKAFVNRVDGLAAELNRVVCGTDGRISLAEFRRVERLWTMVGQVVACVRLEVAQEILENTPEVEEALLQIGGPSEVLGRVATACGVREEIGLVVDCVDETQRTRLEQLLTQGMGEFGLLVQCSSTAQRNNVANQLQTNYSISSQPVPAPLADPIPYREAPAGPAAFAAANPELGVRALAEAFAQACSTPSRYMVSALIDIYDLRQVVLKIVGRLQWWVE